MASPSTLCLKSELSQMASLPSILCSLFPQVGDLQYLMQQYEHWANSLYPKLTFKDVTDRIEKLATKKEFKVSL